MTEERKKELEEMIDEFFKEDDEEEKELKVIDVKLEETLEEKNEIHKGIEFLNDEELLNFEDDIPHKIKFKDIQNKKLKDLTKEERKVALGQMLIITAFIFLNFFIIIQFINIEPNNTVIDNNTGTSTEITVEKSKKDKGTEYTRYITEENLENLDKNSEWKTDKKMNETLKKAINNQDKLDEIEGYELEGTLE